MGNLLGVIEVPAFKPLSLCFGGPVRTDLYVVTGSGEVGAADTQRLSSAALCPTRHRQSPGRRPSTTTTAATAVLPELGPGQRNHLGRHASSGPVPGLLQPPPSAGVAPPGPPPR